MLWKQFKVLFGCLIFLFFTHENVSWGAEICDYPQMGTIQIIRKGEVIKDFSITLAKSTTSQRRGLMHCPSLKPGTGMFFIYPDTKQRVFWMKNTMIELAIIFITPGGRIDAIEHGEPGSLNRIRSSENIKYVLEINYHESRGLAVGDAVRLQLSSIKTNMDRRLPRSLSCENLFMAVVN